MKTNKNNGSVYKFREHYIPERMMKPIQRYITDGVIPGSFLRAIICNDLSACMLADDENLKNLPAFVSYFFWEVPSAAWGSEEKMLAWSKSKKETTK